MSFFFLIVSSFFAFFFVFLFCYFMLFCYYLFLQKLCHYYHWLIFFSWKLLLYFHVPRCSGMFRNVPCSGFYRRPLVLGVKWIILVWKASRSKTTSIFQESSSYAQPTVLTQIIYHQASFVSDLIFPLTVHEYWSFQPFYLCKPSQTLNLLVCVNMHNGHLLYYRGTRPNVSKYARSVSNSFLLTLEACLVNLELL